MNNQFEQNNGLTDSLSINQQSMLDYLSTLELPSDLDTNQMNNNFDSDHVGNSTMDVDQDVADWLDSLLPTTTTNGCGKSTNKSDSILPELNGNCFSSHNSDPLLVGGGGQNQSIFMLDDTDMCQNSIWDQ